MKNKLVGLFFLLFVLVPLLNGCGSAQKKATQEPVLSPDASENFPKYWTINGRISVIHENENWYAHFNWIQQNQNFEISFTGPLGETELQVSRNNQITRVKTPSSERYSNDIEQLILQETGWRFPVKSLRYWSQGKPDPDSDSRLKHNTQQQVSDIYQAGWHIQYPKRMQVGEYLLPRKIIVTEPGLTIKIIVTRWLLGDESYNIN